MSETAVSFAALPPFVRQQLASQDEPVLLELFSARHGLVHRLDGDHPLDLLHGTCFGPQVHGLAVSAMGTVVSDPSLPRGSTIEQGSRVQLLHVLWREGPTTSGLVAAADGVFDWDTMRPFGPADGLIPDAMRRSLDLATPPPELPASTYWLVAWLHAVKALPVTEPVALEQVARWHPGVDPREVDFFDDSDDLVEFCRIRLADHSAITGWEGVRRGAAMGWLDGGACSPELADWFDEGAFSRWLLQGLDRPATLLADCANRLSPEARELLHLVVADVDATTGRDRHL